MKSDLSPIFVTHTPCPRESDGDQGQSPGFPRLARSQAQKSGRAGDKIPRKGGSDNTKSDPPVINTAELAPMIGAALDVMARDSRKMRDEQPFVFANVDKGQGLDDTIAFIADRGMLPEHEVPPGEPDADNTTQTNVFLPVQPIRC